MKNINIKIYDSAWYITDDPVLTGRWKLETLFDQKDNNQYYDKHVLYIEMTFKREKSGHMHTVTTWIHEDAISIIKTFIN